MGITNHSLHWLKRSAAFIVGTASILAGVGIASATTLIGTPGYSYQRADPNGNITLVGVEAWDGSNPTYCIGTGMNTGHVTGDWKDATSPNELIAAQMIKDHLNATHDDMTQAAVSYAIKDHLDTRPDQWNAIKNTPLRGGDINAVRDRAAQYWKDAAAHTPTSAEIRHTNGLAQGVTTAAIRNPSGEYTAGIPWRVRTSGPIHVDGPISGTTTNGPIQIHWHATGHGTADTYVEYVINPGRRQPGVGGEQPLFAPDPDTMWRPLNTEFRVSPEYKLDVTTAQQTGDIRPGSTAGIHDRISVREEKGEPDATYDPINVRGDAILHFDGNGRTPARQSSKPVTITDATVRAGGLDSPAFTPSDLGMTDGWESGSYWFDVQVPKQGQMSEAVDTPDHTESEETALTDKAWTLDRQGALTTDDPTGSNRKGADDQTFVPGDPVSAVVNAHVPTGQANALRSFTVTDDWSDAARYVDFTDPTKAAVYYRGEDVTSEFGIRVDGTRTIATARPSFLSRTRNLSGDTTVKLVISGTFKDVPTGGRKDRLTNGGSMEWNDHGTSTNIPAVFEWTPNPNKEWARNTRADGTGSWVSVTDKDRTNTVNGGGRDYRDGDPLAAIVNGTVPTRLAHAPTTLTLTEDYSQNAYMWQPDGKSVRVYEHDLPASDDAPDASLPDITGTGTDVTDKYDIRVDSGRHLITATIKAAHAQDLKGLAAPRQISMLVPGRVSVAHGRGAAFAREEYGATTISHRHFQKDGREWYRTCVNPEHSTVRGDGQALGKPILNKGGETVNRSTVPTNEPGFCVLIPSTVKSVQAEKSQGGDQHDGDTQKVRPGQKVEYNLSVTDHVPDSGHEGYAPTSASIVDTFDPQATVDPQTIEVKDNDGDTLTAGRDYTASVDPTAHRLAITLSNGWVRANYTPGATVRLRVRFEATVSTELECGRKVDNTYDYRVNNSVTRSNKVTNTYECPTRKKEVTQTGKPSVDINGKRLLLGDKYDYRLTFDATDLTNGWSTKNADGTITRGGQQVYRVQRLGMTDAYDAKHLSVDPRNVRVLDQDGHDVTGKFNVALEDNVLYVFARTVDTRNVASGDMVPGNPQPRSLKEYAARHLDRLTDPYIDQSILGQRYTIVMPATVIRVEEDGAKVDNVATEIVDDQQYLTNKVTNELKRINPSKDVVINVGQDSANGKSVYKGHFFLYRLQSSRRPSGLAYPEVTDWHITDQLDPTYDRYTGQWAVYADTDLKAPDGTLVARQGQKIAGSGFTPTDAIRHVLQDGDTQLFTVREDTSHLVTVTATGSYRKLVSDGTQDAQWSAYIQVQRMKATEHHDNRFDEWINGVKRPSNTVWTRTPNQTPSISLEKYDVASGLKDGDRNKPEQALSDAKDGTRIGFRITNTGRSPLTKITLADQTIAGSGTVQDIDLTPLKGLTLQPGQSVTVYGTLKGVKDGDHHTDRGTTTGKPLLPCAVPQPGLPDTSAPATPSDGGQPKLCEDTPIRATDDWNGLRQPQLAHTGAAVATVAILALLLTSLGIGLAFARRNHGMSQRKHTASHAA